MKRILIAMLATLGRSVVGRNAENILIDAAARVKANGGHPVPLAAEALEAMQEELGM